jgi:hypothetical protein
LKSGYYDGWENGSQILFTNKLIFNSFFTLLNQFIAFKNTKKINTKSKINSKPQIFPSSYLVFRHFQGQKTSTLNSPHYIESFNTKIDHFSDHNHHQLSLFLSTMKFNDSLSLLSPKKDWKIRKIKFGIKINFLKIKGTG